jgi:hypothetical protein
MSGPARWDATSGFSVFLQLKSLLFAFIRKGPESFDVAISFGTCGICAFDVES